MSEFTINEMKEMQKTNGKVFLLKWGKTNYYGWLEKLAK